MPTLYHSTPISNLESILKDGLIPQIGERSIQLNESAGVYLFTSYEQCENALCNWLGEEFDELDEDVVTLEIELPDAFPLEESVEWEAVARERIQPTYIKFYKNEG